ncbi:MAG: helix-turn-helix transcriptional regulator [Gallionellaceae bacterium]
MNWFELLQNAVGSSSITAVAEKLDISRAAISLVLSGKYPAKTDRIAARVLDTYARLTCPHTHIEITRAECRAASTSSVPTSSPQAMRHWRACQSCHNKGVKS